MSAGSSEGNPERQPPEQRPPPRDLLEEVLARGVAEIETRRSLDAFLSEPDWSKAIELWLGSQGLQARALTLERIGRLLGRDIARLDVLISRQVNAILHHPRFQQLEASWRGLYFLTQQAVSAREQIEAEGDKVQVRIELLNVSKDELFRDFERAAEFDRSQIWRKVYEDEFGMPGGEPFGAVVADYEFTNHPKDVDLIGKMAEVAAASFCPFIASASPKLLQIDSFATLEQPLNLSATMEQLDYMRWRSLRERDDTRFIGLTLPHVLMRLPYEDDGSRADGFRFREDVEAPDYRNYLWGSAAYAFASVLLRAFGGSRWFADIRGMERDVEAGGVVTDLPVHSFATDRRGVATKASLEVRVGE
jgi:type VI secretion system protein ImpD